MGVLAINIAAGHAISDDRAARRDDRRRPIPAPTRETVQNSVTQVIEQQLTGVDNLLYFSSSSSSNGQVQITATFAPGTNPDIAQVQVQNKVQQALPRPAAGGAAAGRRRPEIAEQLPARSSRSTTTAAATRISTSPTSSRASCRIRSRACPASAQAQVFGAPYAMRIWLDPFKLQQLQPDARRRAATPILAQNVQVSAGELGRAAGRSRASSSTRRSPRNRGCRRPSNSAQHRAEEQPPAARSCGCAMWRASSSARKSYAVVSRMNGKPGVRHRDPACAGRQRAHDGRRGEGQGDGTRVDVPAGRQARLSRRQHDLHPLSIQRRDQDADRGDRARRSS